LVSEGLEVARRGFSLVVNVFLGNKAAPVVALLLSFGSDPERRAHVHFTAEDSETVLDIASRKGCPEVTDVLNTWLASKRRAEQDAAQMGIKQFLQSSEYSDVTFILTPDACKVGGSTRDCVPAAVPDHMDKQRRSEGGVRRGKKRVAAGGKAVNSKQLRIPAHKVHSKVNNKLSRMTQGQLKVQSPALLVDSEPQLWTAMVSSTEEQTVFAGMNTVQV
jgi:hypothetical protein